MKNVRHKQFTITLSSMKFHQIVCHREPFMIFFVSSLVQETMEMIVLKTIPNISK